MPGRSITPDQYYDKDAGIYLPKNTPDHKYYNEETWTFDDTVDIRAPHSSIFKPVFAQYDSDICTVHFATGRCFINRDTALVLCQKSWTFAQLTRMPNTSEDAQDYGVPEDVYFKNSLITPFLFQYLVRIAVGLPRVGELKWLASASPERIAQLFEDMLKVETAIAGKDGFGPEVKAYISHKLYLKEPKKREWDTNVTFLFKDGVVDVPEYMARKLAKKHGAFHNLITNIDALQGPAEDYPLHSTVDFTDKDFSPHAFQYAVYYHLERPHNSNDPRCYPLLRQSLEDLQAFRYDLTRINHSIFGHCDDLMPKGIYKDIQLLKDLQMHPKHNADAPQQSMLGHDPNDWYEVTKSEQGLASLPYADEAAPPPPFCPNVQRIELRDPTNEEIIKLSERCWTLLSSKEENGSLVQVLGRYYPSASYR